VSIVGISLLGLSVLLIAYAFVVYPLWMQIAARTAPEIQRGTATPPVTLVIAARNEGQHIASRLENACALTYPDLLIVVASDGSSDDTVEQARSCDDPRVRVVAVDTPGGKTSTVATAIETWGRPGIYAFTDATARWPDDALQYLVAPLSDPSVGAVSGLVVYDYHPEAISRGFQLYQSLVVPSRAADSRVGWVTSVSGSICAIRSELWERVPAELSTDLAYPLLAAARGQRAVLEPRAISAEDSRRRPDREFSSRLRLALNAYTFVGYLLRRRRDLPRRYLWQVTSHKVLRWLAPALASFGLLGSILVYGIWPELTLSTVSGTAAFVGLGLLGLVPAIGRWFAAPLWVLTVVAAYLLGLLKYLGGTRIAGWDPQSQR